jgi:hypothetical protein
MLNEGFNKLKIHQLAHQLANEVHSMTLKLRKLDTFEEASQIRRSSKSVSAQIVVGYSPRKYKHEYLHLESLFETKSFADAVLFKDLRDRYEVLGKQEFTFIQTVESWTEPPRFVKDECEDYTPKP